MPVATGQSSNSTAPAPVERSPHLPLSQDPTVPASRGMNPTSPACCVWGVPGSAKLKIAQQAAVAANRQYTKVRALLLVPVGLR